MTETISLSTKRAIGRLLDSTSERITWAREHNTVGDGVADDTSALQSAINERSTLGGGIIVLPVGTFLITSTITLPSDVLLVGAGMRVCTITGDLTAPLISPTNATAQFNSIGIEHILLDNTDKTNAGGIGIDFTNVSQGYIRDVQIQNCETGILLDTANSKGCFYNEISHVFCSTCDKGVLIDNGANQNKINFGKMQSVDEGIEINGSNGIGISGVAFETFANNGVKLVDETPWGAAISVIDCRFENSGGVGTGIFVGADSWTNFNFTANYFTGVSNEISYGGTLDAENRGIKADDGIIRCGEIRVTEVSAGDPKLELYQSSSLRAFVKYEDSGDRLRIDSDGVVRLAPNNGSSGVTDFQNDGSVTFPAEIEMGASGPTISTGSGTPESVVTAVVGSLYLRTDGGAGTTLYVKESGTGTTGWVAK